ncbi:hypothetical protein BJX99DRAFT_119514 [Aspergillus californicus]
MSQSNAPDLNAILRTLSAFSNQTNTQPPHPETTTSTQDDDLNTYEPPDVHPVPPSNPPPLHKSPPNNSHAQPQNTTREKEKDLSSTITTWPPALKQVMRTVAANEEIQQRIRFLIQRQHDHEKQWWRGREALLLKQKTRSEKKRELDEVLRSVGAPIDEKDVSTPKEDQAEVTNYDTKVYKASKQMADAMLAELRALNVPFFCLKQGLVVDGSAPDRGQDSGPDHSTGGREEHRLSLDEVSTLQRRMLELLQDLCKE